MAKAISQEFFDESVQTNIDLLGLTVEEAIKMTIESFKLEGVDLSKIITDKIKYNAEHPITIAVNSLSQALKDETLSEKTCTTCLEILLECVDTDDSGRIYVINSGLLDQLRHALTFLVNNCQFEFATRICDNVASLMTGHFHMLPEDFLSVIIENALKLVAGFPETLADDFRINLLASFLTLLRSTCLGNEPVRAKIAKFSLHVKLTEALREIDPDTVKKSTSISRLVCRACSFIRSMLLDDDMRADFGEGFQHARAVASLPGSVTLFLKFAKSALETENYDLAVDTSLTLAALLTREEFCIEFLDAGGLDFVFNALLSYPDNLTVCTSTIALLRSASASDACKRGASNWTQSGNVSVDAAARGPTLLIATLEHFLLQSALVRHGALAIAAMTLRQPEAASRLVEAGVADLLTRCLEVHQQTNNYSTVRAICLAIRNCVARSPDLRSAFVPTATVNSSENDVSPPEGLELLLNSVLTIRECGDEAKSALRDLGCHVKLSEPWKGQKNDVTTNVL